MTPLGLITGGRNYPAALVSLHDGDTLTATLTLGPVDLGLGFIASATRIERLRFAGINAPELSALGGAAAAAFVHDLMATVANFTVRTHLDTRDNYGRLLAWIILPDGRCLNRLVIDSGHAVPYGSFPVDPPA